MQARSQRACRRAEPHRSLVPFAELRALRGATRQLSGPNRIRVIKLELYPPGIRAIGDDPMTLLELLDDAGYDLSHVGGHVVDEHSATPLHRPGFNAFVRSMEDKFTDLVARARDV